MAIRRVSRRSVEGDRLIDVLSRRRRFPDLFRTHSFPISTASIVTATGFTARTGDITFAASVRILDNGTDPGQHRGLVFEFGDTARGVALWIGDETIGLHAGAAGTADGATALYDLEDELPPGALFNLVASVRPATGQVILWGNGRELARSAASNGDFGSPNEWSADGSGSFGTDAQGTLVSDVPAASQGAPDDGFAIVSPLSIYYGQIPRRGF